MKAKPTGLCAVQGRGAGDGKDQLEAELAQSSVVQGLAKELPEPVLGRGSSAALRSGAARALGVTGTVCDPRSAD